MRKILLVIALAGFMVIFSGCSPPTFVRTSVANWKTVEFRPGLEREDAWHRIADTLAKNYDIEVIDKESGYIRSGWMYNLSGKINENYRTRVIVNIPVSNDKVELKIDAHWFDSSNWIPGYDTLLLNQVYTDVQGSVGRVTR